MNTKEQKALDDLHRQMTHLQKTIDEGGRLVRWMKNRKKSIPVDARIRVGVDVSSATNKDWRTCHIFANLPMKIAYEALLPGVEAMVKQAKVDLAALEPVIK